MDVKLAKYTLHERWEEIIWGSFEYHTPFQ